MVLNDVRNGYVTVEQAKAVYAVSIEASNGDLSLNESKTRELRVRKQS